MELYLAQCVVNLINWFLAGIGLSLGVLLMNKVSKGQLISRGDIVILDDNVDEK